MLIVGDIISTTSKASRALVYQLLSEKWSSYYALLPAVFNLLPTSIWNVCSCAIKEASMKSTENYSSRKPSCATTKSTLLAVSKDEWNTKEGTGKSMKNALYTC